MLSYVISEDLARRAVYKDVLHEQLKGILFTFGILTCFSPVSCVFNRVVRFISDKRDTVCF